MAAFAPGVGVPVDPVPFLDLPSLLPPLPEPLPSGEQGSLGKTSSFLRRAYLENPDYKLKLINVLGTNS